MTKQIGDVMAACNMQRMSTGEILLEDEFEVFPNEKRRYKVELTRTEIIYYPVEIATSKKTVKLHFGDVIGCRCKKSLDEKHVRKAYLTVFAYPLKKKMFSEKWIRYKNHITFSRSIGSSFDENRKVLEKWRLVIIQLCKQLSVNKKEWQKVEKNGVPWQLTFFKENGTHSDNINKCSLHPKTKFLVLVNPKSGPGKAMKIYQKQVKPMLDEADILIKLIETDHAGHGAELMKTINIDEYYGVVIVSGDGLIYEVVNGLMNRDDWHEAMKFPIGCVPGGSGNALSCSIRYSAGEPIDTDVVLHSTFILIKHCIIPMDIVLIEQPHQHIFSFLSVSWGLMGDIDYESEKYRYMGEARFTVQAIKRIISLRKYKGRLSFLPVRQYIPKAVNNNNTKFQHVGTKNRTVSLEDIDDDTEEFLPGGQHSKSVPNQLFLCKTVSELEIGEGDENVEQLTDINSESLESDSFTSTMQEDFRQNNNKDVKFGLSNEEDDCNQVSIDKSKNMNMRFKISDHFPLLLAPLNQPVPKDWVTIEEEFISVCACYQTHLGSDLIMAPDARFNDGIINLCFIKAGILKNELIQLMGMLEKGTHIDHPSPYLEFIKVLAFRLEPEGNEGIIMVDGERVDYGPLQAQVLPGLAQLMAIQ